ncbi:MAG TPA: EAL domain-containing protein, partial [Actinomycetales bacterium]
MAPAHDSTAGRPGAAQLATVMLDALESPTCAVDQQGLIIAVNAAWLRYGGENGGEDDPAKVLGSDYLAVCDAASGPRSRHATEVGEALRAVIGGSLPRFEVDYPCHSPSTQRWFSLRLSALPGLGALVAHHDVTALRVRQRELRRRRPRVVEAALSPWTARPDDLGPTGAPDAGTTAHGARVVTPADVRAALDRDELVLHYQPVVDLVSSRVTAVEALVRWQHPIDGLIAPDEFIPVAEAGGLIAALGSRVLERACAQAVLWREQGLDLDMAVNVSTLQVAQPGLIETLEAALLETGLDPARLLLELTESAVLEDAEAAARVLTAIAAMGVSLAIDDFGTGYSSLVYLKRYPIRALKVDRSFVAGMGTHDEDDAIVASVVGLARAVGGACIVEGIETPAQYAALVALGGGLDAGWLFGQGWLLGAAVPADELPALVVRCEAQLAERRGGSATRAQQRDEAGVRRDQAADARDLRGDQRDLAAGRRDEVGDRRDRVAWRRDRVRDDRDELADERDVIADRRDE